MSAIKKPSNQHELLQDIDTLQKFMKSLSEKERKEFANRLGSIRNKVEKLLFQEEEEAFYYDAVNQSLEDVWNNEKDDAYNEL